MNKQQFRILWSMVRSVKHDRIGVCQHHECKMSVERTVLKIFPTAKEIGKGRWADECALVHRIYAKREERPEESEWEKYARYYRDQRTGPVFYYHWGRDCDLMEVWEFHAFPNQYEADKAIDRSYECAEGPESWSKITEQEYNDHRDEGGFRDRAAEMMGY